MTIESEATTGLSWEREDMHFPDRLSRWGAELFTTRQSRGIAEICADAGLLFDGVRITEIDGWAYAAVIPPGGKPRPSPPPWLMPLLVRVVPDLRRRIATMRRLDREGYWPRVVDEWLAGGEAALLRRGAEFLERDLAALDDRSLALEIERAWNYADDAVKKHFHLHGAGINEIMVLSMELNRDHGFTTADVSGLLTGLSDTTTGPAAHQAALIEIIRDHGGAAELRRATSLQDVKAIGEPVAAAMDDYMYTWGRRAIRYEVAYPTVAESPTWLLDQLKMQLDRPQPAELEHRHAATRADVEQRVVAALGDTAETHDRIRRARRAFPIREGNEAATVGIPAAVLRRLGLAAGERLVARGALEAVEHVFDAKPEAVLLALRGAVPAELRTAAAARHADRLGADPTAAPRTLGPPPSLPDLTGFPDDIRTLVEAVIWFSSKASTIETGVPDADDEARASRVDGSVASGLGVSPGIYEGPARVVLDESGFDDIEPGDVLVCPITSPVWSMVFPSLGALVCDAGGPLSHPAIIAREFGIPAVVATENATSELVSGQLIRVDGTTGSITTVDRA